MMDSLAIISQRCLEAQEKLEIVTKERDAAIAEVARLRSVGHGLIADNNALRNRICDAINLLRKVEVSDLELKDRAI
jgi:hypothetical protein